MLLLVGVVVLRVNQARSSLVHHPADITCLPVQGGEHASTARLLEPNLVSSLFKEGLFQFTGRESLVSAPSARRCLVSLLKI